MVVDRMRITTMARDTIDAAIATTTIGKEEPGANPGFFFVWLRCKDTGGWGF
jgi:hypothetical protein